MVSASNAMKEDILRENARIPEGNTPNRTRNHPDQAIGRDQEMNLDTTKRKTKAESTIFFFFLILFYLFFFFFFFLINQKKIFFLNLQQK